MKRLGAIAVVVILLLAAALFYSKAKQNKKTPTPPDDPTVTVVTPTPTPKTTKSGVPVTRASVDGTLKLGAAISHGFVPTAGQPEMYAAIDVSAVAHKGSKRPPLNLALVIDRSGSMSGDKVFNAKDAARRLVTMLNAQDRLAIVSYGSDVTTEYSSRPVTAANRQEMLAAIDRVSVSGGTNLSGGYDRGLSEVKRWKNASSVNRVILMSDGNANIGITYIPELEQLSRRGLNDGVSLTTMGVGLDYNEDLMTRMANEGAGNYYFIEKATEIAGIFEKEMKGLTNVVARNAVVVVTLAEGVELTELYGFPHRREGQKVMISLAEFFSEQKKSILSKLRVPAGVEGMRAVIDVALSYEDITRDKPAHGALALKSVAVVDTAKATEGINADVISRVQQIEVASSLQKAMELYDKGEGAAAVGLLKKQQTRMRSARKRYKLKDAKRFDRVDRELEATNKMMLSAPASAPKGRALIKRKKARSNYIMFDDSSF